MYAHGSVLPARSVLELGWPVESFVDVCEWQCLKVNMKKSKVMIVEREGESVCNVQMNGEMSELVEPDFKSLGAMTEKRGKCIREVENRVAQSREVAGAMTTLVHPKGLSTEAARELHEGLLMCVCVYITIFLQPTGDYRYPH